MARPTMINNFTGTHWNEWSAGKLILYSLFSINIIILLSDQLKFKYRVHKYKVKDHHDDEDDRVVLTTRLIVLPGQLRGFRAVFVLAHGATLCYNL